MPVNYLKKALELAEIRRGFCAPNPAVGAVVVKDDQVLATGYHWASGSPHAEVAALKPLNEQAPGATLYITLEPCCHFGKTPPCTALIIRSGIKQVVYGARDPNPQVAGKSDAILTAAGIEVIYQPLPEITDFYQSYTFWWKTKRPYVTAKIALSLDGKIAGAQGQRVAITGEVAQQFTHQQRKRSDAILTTAKTVICDDPLLTVRLPDENLRKPVYILDRQLITPVSAKLFNTAEKVILFYENTPENAIKMAAYLKKGAHGIAVATQNGGLNLEAVLRHIGEEGVQDLWVEAGGRCFAGLVRQGLVQRAFVYVAPKWLGAEAQTAFDGAENIFAGVKEIKWQSLSVDGMCEMVW